MHGWKIRSVVLILAVAFILTSTGLKVLAMDQDHYQDRRDKPSAPAMMADFVIARPLGLAATALGIAFFVASLPFSLTGGNTKAAFHNLVAAPAKFTFNRPLGEGTQPDR